MDEIKKYSKNIESEIDELYFLNFHLNFIMKYIEDKYVSDDKQFINKLYLIHLNEIDEELNQKYKNSYKILCNENEKFLCQFENIDEKKNKQIHYYDEMIKNELDPNKIKQIEKNKKNIIEHYDKMYEYCDKMNKLYNENKISNKNDFNDFIDRNKEKIRKELSPDIKESDLYINLKQTSGLFDDKNWKLNLLMDSDEHIETNTDICDNFDDYVL